MSNYTKINIIDNNINNNKYYVNQCSSYDEALTAKLECSKLSALFSRKYANNTNSIRATFINSQQ